jgi:hypothetical protein
VAKKIPLLMTEAEKEVEVDAKHAKITISYQKILIMVLVLRLIAHEVMPLR